MCGIIAVVSDKNCVSILMEGLKRLEYRGYDSTGLAVTDRDNRLNRIRVSGKVNELNAEVKKTKISGNTGVAHTRWATHGAPLERNAHPHIAYNQYAFVHNGIFENHLALGSVLKEKGYCFSSDTDSEVALYYILDKVKNNSSVLESVLASMHELKGAYAFCLMDVKQPSRVLGVRNGPPLVIGIGKNENFLASDVLALQGHSEQFVFLEEGDVAIVYKDKYIIYDTYLNRVERKIYRRIIKNDPVDKKGYAHFMEKEINEQPLAIRNTLEEKIKEGYVDIEKAFGLNSESIFSKIKRVQIVGCGTSYYSGLIGHLWLESIVGIPCQVEIASEFRYRKRVPLSADTLVVLISQSGETADTLAALREIRKDPKIPTLAICNVPNSSLVRETDLVFLTNAGPEISVCSTKAFVTQLVALSFLFLVLGRNQGLSRVKEMEYLQSLLTVPDLVQWVLSRSPMYKSLAKVFMDKSHSVFIGRGLQLPIALEGALKLKEISYIHAEAYPAGELKHGPLALVDKELPVIILAPNDTLLDKLKSNIQEIRARGGKLIVFAPVSSQIEAHASTHIIQMPEIDAWLAPFVYIVPLQLLAYYVSVLRGTNIDQPRNLAKSVTVE